MSWGKSVLVIFSLSSLSYSPDLNPQEMQAVCKRAISNIRNQIREIENISSSDKSEASKGSDPSLYPELDAAFEKACASTASYLEYEKKKFEDLLKKSKAEADNLQ